MGIDNEAIGRLTAAWREVDVESGALGSDHEDEVAAAMAAAAANHQLIVRQAPEFGVARLKRSGQ